MKGVACPPVPQFLNVCRSIHELGIDTLYVTSRRQEWTPSRGLLFDHKRKLCSLAASASSARLRSATSFLSTSLAAAKFCGPLRDAVIEFVGNALLFGQQSCLL